MVSAVLSPSKALLLQAKTSLLPSVSVQPLLDTLVTPPHSFPPFSIILLRGGWTVASPNTVCPSLFNTNGTLVPSFSSLDLVPHSVLLELQQLKATGEPESGFPGCHCDFRGVI